MFPIPCKICHNIAASAQPKTIRLYGAIGHITTRGNYSFQNGLALYSPILTIRIDTPDDAWVVSQIAAATADIKNGSVSQARKAVRMLRYLDDPKAVQQLVSALSDSQLGDEALLGLMSSKNPYQAKSALWENLHSPDIAITDNYFKTLVDLLIPPEIYSLYLRSLTPQFKTAQQDARKQVIQELLTALPLKRYRALYEACNLLVKQGIDQKTIQPYCQKGN
jgi:hypothetical protein